MDLTTFKKEKCELMSRKAEIDDRKIGSKKTKSVNHETELKKL